MAAVRLWGTLLSGVMSSGKGIAESAQSGAEAVLSTEFVMHQLSYYFMVWSSLTFGGILLIEQYFGRRIFCFQPANFTQPPAAIGEYCWEHGYFESNQSHLEFYFENHDWILNSFVYFFLRATVFVLPHLIWQKKYEAWIVAMIKGSVGLVKELQRLWIQLSEVADEAYRNIPNTDENSSKKRQKIHTDKNPDISSELNDKQIKLQQTYKTVLAMTRDVVQITKQQIPNYTAVYYFVTGRLIYDVLMMILFSILDLFMFHLSNKYNSTDYYCQLPNTEIIRCMVPMMSFQWYASFLAVTSGVFMCAITIIYTIVTLCSLCCKSAKGTFLDHIPFASEAADTNWYSHVECKTYKIMSKLMMQNICILHPLNFLRSFVRHLEENHQIGEDLLSKTTQNSFQMSVNAFPGYDVEETDGDDQLWRRLLQT